jgi:hypothetical protein
MTETQARYLIGNLLMQANAKDTLPLALKVTGQDLGDWPPAGGMPTHFHQFIGGDGLTITFHGPDWIRKYRIAIEEIP